ncbi:unnamed protein product [Phytophthora fragariaefolia]|uniref:Unnamed protein product n=1 Tax=Phytophthora fragariaefolia TaxID=1490495 RepID=A0A9W6XDA9_9STRA|nr:unnamed protein product [Phytophthora fragariaefolia]
MSMPTTQTTGTPAAGVPVTTGSSPASTPVVTSTVTTSSSPKRTTSLGDDADMEGGEEDEEASSSRHDEPGVGSRRPREDDSDASISKRLCSGSDRPLDEAGPLSSPRSGGNSTPSGVEASRTGPVRDPWMPTPIEMESRFGNTAPPGQHTLYSCGGIKHYDVTKELHFRRVTDQRRDYYIGRVHELRWYGNKNTSRRSRVPEWQALCQSWGAFVENFNKNPVGYLERVRSASERYERFSERPKIERLHWGAVEAGIPCAMPMGMRASAATSGQCSCPNATLTCTRVSVCPRN